MTSVNIASLTKFLMFSFNYFIQWSEVVLMFSSEFRASSFKFNSIRQVISD